jgi:putative membrane protein
MMAPLSSRVTNHLANERTFLAWLRTAIAMMGFGILMVRLRSSAPPGAGRGPVHVAQIGLLFALIALAMVGFALWNYIATRRAIDNDSYRAGATGIVVFSVLILLLGVFVVVYLWTVAPLPASPNGF